MTRLRSFSKPLAMSLLLGAGLMLCGGCVGLNIPSVRYHDAPTPPGAPRTLDEALLFSRDGGSGPGGPPAAVGHGPVGEGFPMVGPYPPGTGGPGACATGDCGEELEEPAGPGAALPAVPWPRFHPVPTTPVFAG
ncbi:hypothetical protein [Roseimaritima ulvae]|nr:hypothetical protein [Roseimaritima ulvae]